MGGLSRRSCTAKDRRRRLTTAIAGALVGMLMSSSARADCIQGAFANPVAPFSTYTVMYPNWLRAPAAAFSLQECDDITCAFCATSSLTGLTIANYGTATGSATGDITNVYFNYVCGTVTTAVTAMTYAGVWDLGGPVVPVWTWAGTLAIPGDPCDTDCYCWPSISVYTDIGPCPQDRATIELGPAFNSASSQGGITDSCGCSAPTMSTMAEQKMIMYIHKTADKPTAAPGDTVNYTVYYGLPGTAALTSITVWDTLPDYTHLLSGSPSPAADPGYDPDFGPPMHLK